MPAESPAPSGVAPFAYASLIFRTCMQVAYARAMVSREGRAQHARRADEVQRAPGRTPWGSITRAQIIEAAMTVVKAGGYDQMTVRSLAAELGVSPMSLYRHIRDKDDLLDEVVDRLLANAWRPRCAKEDWRAWMAEAADRLRRLLVSQPAALHVYLRHPVVSPAAIARMEAMMSVLRRAGAEEQAARRAYAAVHTYTIGFAALESSRVSWAPRGAATDSLADELATYTAPEQFAEGLRYLLDGFEHQGWRPQMGSGQ
jgi:TetR/AcrR family transcriptional regulator, tetracycline repressor protein